MLYWKSGSNEDVGDKYGDGGIDHLGNTGSASPNSSSGEEPEEPSDAYKYQRRRSRAVLYHLSGTYGKHKSRKSKLQLNKVGLRMIWIQTNQESNQS